MFVLWQRDCFRPFGCFSRSSNLRNLRLDQTKSQPKLSSVMNLLISLFLLAGTQPCIRTAKPVSSIPENYKLVYQQDFDSRNRWGVCCNRQTGLEMGKRKGVGSSSILRRASTNMRFVPPTILPWSKESRSRTSFSRQSSVKRAGNTVIGICACSTISRVVLIFTTLTPQA